MVFLPTRFEKRRKPMRRRLSYLVALSAVALLLVPIAIAQGQDQSVQSVPIQDVAAVSIEDNYFDVADIAVEPGTTVIWTNEGQVPHTVTADDGSFDSEELNPGDTYIVTFLGSGTVSYYCEIHPEMVGSVTVGGAGGGGGASEYAPTTEQQSSGEESYESMEPTSYY